MSDELSIEILEDAAARQVQGEWRRHASQRFARVQAMLREMCKCVVCGDHCTHMVRCSNGHTCCGGCAIGGGNPAADRRCPMCRETRALVADSSVPAMLDMCGTTMRCGMCAARLTARDCERHRAWCPRYEFVCPWPACQHCACAKDMAGHVRGHRGVHVLTRTRDGTYHAMLAMVLSNDLQVFCVGDAVVVLTATVRRVLGGATALDDAAHTTVAPQLHVAARAYYPSGDAPVVSASLRQLSVEQCEHHNLWLEEYRIPEVPPMIASREAIMVGGSTGVTLTPHSLMLDAASSSSHLGAPSAVTVSLPNHQPGGVTRVAYLKMRNLGIRSLPTAMRPLDTVDPTLTPVAIVHVVLREVTPLPGRGKISDAFPV